MILEDGMLEINEIDTNKIEGGTSASEYRSSASSYQSTSSICGLIAPVTLMNPYTAVLAGVPLFIVSLWAGGQAGDAQNSATDADQKDANNKNTINQGQIVASSMTPVC